MEALSLHHRHHTLCPSFHYYCSSSLTPSFSSSSYSSSSSPSYSLFLSPPHSSSSSIVASSSDPPLQHSDPKSPQSFNPLRKLPSYLTVTAASASAFLFLGFCRNDFINNRPIKSSSSPIIAQEEALDENRHDVESSIFHLKLDEKLAIVHSFRRTKSVDEEAWQVLKSEVCRSSEEFEFVRIGFEKILEKEPRAYHDCVLEHLEMIDECKSLLKGIKVAMERCERENVDVKHSLRFFTRVVARIRVLEGDMLCALSYYKDLDKD